jgi:hypothetical protein
VIVTCGPSGLSRRDFLRVGALGCGGLGLADLLRADATAAAPRRPKSLIYIVLNGGPSHIDMYDLKPDAPDEYRGPFRPIATALPGVRIAEHLPLQASIMDRLALLRGVRSVENDHFLSEVYTGLPRTAGRRPAFGSVVSRLAGGTAALPAYVSLERPATGEFDFEQPHYAGAGHAPFRPFGDALQNLAPPQDLDRMQDRRRLLTAFDAMRRDLDRQVPGLDRFQAQALDMIASPRVRDAFDLSREPERVRLAYGKGGKFTHQTAKSIVYDFDSRPFLLARRLVEAGVRVVTLRVPEWDHHSGGGADIFYSLKLMLPALDRAFFALVSDLEARGLADDVLVVMLGEFGRTPKISQPGPGREHWAEAGCAIFAGGGLTMGQVVGETDAWAERAKTGQIGFQNIMATIYKVLGVDPFVKLPDFNGRPQHILSDREPVRELVG